MLATLCVQMSQLFLVATLHQFLMDSEGHQPVQHLEGQWLTAVTLDIKCQDQLQWLVGPVGAGAQDLLAQVATGYIALQFLIQVTCFTHVSYSLCSNVTAVSCGYPPSISNGFRGTPTRTTFGGTVTYSCNTGYQLSGSATVTCQASGSWSTRPSCTGSYITLQFLIQVTCFTR